MPRNDTETNRHPNRDASYIDEALLNRILATKAMTADEAGCLVAAAVTVMRKAGVRPDELHNAHGADFNRSSGRLIIRNGKCPRRIFLTGRARTHLKTATNGQATQLLTGPSGRPLDPATFSHRWSVAVSAVNRPGLSVHALRASWIADQIGARVEGKRA
jgi:integrase